MTELNDREPVWVKNLNTDIRTTVAYYKTKDSRYMKRCNLKLIDERLVGKEIIVAPIEIKTPEEKVKELKQTFGIEQIQAEPLVMKETFPEPVTANSEDPKALRKRLFAEAEEKGIKVAKNIKTEDLIEKLK